MCSGGYCAMRLANCSCTLPIASIVIGAFETMSYPILIFIIENFRNACVKVNSDQFVFIDDVISVSIHGCET